MNKIIFNSLLKSTQKPYNQHLWLNILSAVKEKKKIPKQEKNKINVYDYLIEYKLVFENGKGEKIKNDDFIYHTYLSEFANKEQTFIRQLIKLRDAVIESGKTITTEAVVI